MDRFTQSVADLISKGRTSAATAMLRNGNPTQVAAAIVMMVSSGALDGAGGLELLDNAVPREPAEIETSKVDLDSAADRRDTGHT